MKTRFVLLGFTISLAAAAFAGPVDDLRAGLNVDFDFDRFDLVLSGALSQTIPITGVPAVCAPKAQGSLDMGLDLAAIIGIPGLPTIGFQGSDQGGDVVKWTIGNTLINQCLPASQTGLPFDLLVKRIIKGELTAQTVNIPVFNDTVCNEDYNVRFDRTGPSRDNFILVEAFAFCIESPRTRIELRATHMHYNGFGGVPEPASMVALGVGLVGLTLRRRRK